MEQITYTNGCLEKMTIKDLAKLAIEVLDAQKKYFRTRDRDDLIASKNLESELRQKANAVLEGM